MSDFSKIYEYINKTPENINPAVLKSLIETEYGSGEVYEPETISGDGDVIVVYNNSLIGVLSDSGTLTLDTEGKVVEHDIVVDYTKPESEPSIRLGNCTVTSVANIRIRQGAFLFGSDLTNSLYIINPMTTALNGIPNKYTDGIDNRPGFTLPRAFNFVIDSREDQYDVKVNNVSVPFNVDAYSYELDTSNLDELPDLTIVVTDK